MNTLKIPRFSAQQKNQDNMLLLVSGQDFKKEVEAIRKKFKISAKTPRELGYSDIFPFKKALSELCRSYRLPKNYDHYVERHILFGETNAPLNNFDICPSPDSLIPGEARYISINVYAMPTDTELEDLKKEIKIMGKMLPSFRPIKDVEKKIESEKIIAGKVAHNEMSCKEDRMTLKEMRGAERAKQDSENHRELKKHRSKRFGKQRAKFSE